MTKAEKLIIEGRIEARKETIVSLFEKAGSTIDQLVSCLDADRSFVESTLLEHGLIKK